MTDFGSRVTNVILRLASAGSRLILLLVLARLLPPQEIGQYGLVLATVLLGVAIIGAEFYAYSTRELLSSERARWSFIIQHSLAAWAMVYLALAPIIVATMPWWSIGDLSPVWLPSLLVTEHLCQEANRLLVALRRPLAASVVMFVRMGAWVWVVLPWMWLSPPARSLDTVLGAWLIGGALALTLSIRLIGGEVAGWRRWDWDWGWIRRGFGVGLVYLLSSFVVRGMFTLDRYWMDHLAGADRLGVYVLYMGLATAIMTILEPAVFSFLQPRLVTALRTGDRRQYQHIFRELRLSVFALATGLALAIAAVAPFLIEWIGKPLYAEDQSLLWALLVMAWVFSIGMTLDSALYAHGEDRKLALASVFGLLIFLGAVPLLATIDRLHSVAWGLLFGFLGAYGLKRNVLKSLENNAYAKH